MAYVPDQERPWFVLVNKTRPRIVGRFENFEQAHEAMIARLQTGERRLEMTQDGNTIVDERYMRVCTIVEIAELRKTSLRGWRKRITQFSQLTRRYWGRMRIFSYVLGDWPKSLLKGVLR